MWHLMANSRNESMEVWETRYPVEFLAYRLVHDSGGPGRWRGGLGTERRMGRVPTRLRDLGHHGSARSAGGRAARASERLRARARRRATDGAGALRPASPSKFANLPLQAGDVFVSIQGGGGGFGDPRERAREDVAADVRAGYVSPERARELYGWEVTP